MMRRLFVTSVAALMVLALTGLAADDKKEIKVLIITGDQVSAHDWKATTPFIKDFLSKAGMKVDVTETPRKDLTADNLSKYDVLLLNYKDTKNGGPDTRWSDDNKKAFTDAVKDGKGLLVYHYASAAFVGGSDFDKEFERIIAGGWRKQGNHGKRHVFTVAIRNHDHPITRGLTDSFQHSNDELYQNSVMLRDSVVLATAYSDKSLDPKNTGKHEPVVWVSHYGKGRVCENVLGHDVAAMRSPGFQALMIRAVEWCATGKVQSPVPAELKKKESSAAADGAAAPWVVYQGGDGPGKGKHIVLISGDEEYRSEEALPQLGKILAKHHGFKCTVLFALDKDGTINPNKNDNIPGLEHLKNADLMILFTRFRNLPDEQMKHIVEYVESGKPIIGMRTATHAFNLKSQTYARYSWNSNAEWRGGFGRQILGETWVNHWGHHGSQSTRGILVPDQKDNPILRGIKDGDIWGPTDVYEVHLGRECTPLVLGQVLKGMKPDDPAADGKDAKKNEPMMPVAWTKSYKGLSDKTGRVFTTTMGAAQDLQSEGLRRLLVNAAYWAVGMEDKIDAKAKVALVGEYKPTRFGFNGFQKGVKPSDLADK
jgi:type 1 glutamine amidotransferase